MLTKIARALFIKHSRNVTVVVALVAIFGYYLGSKIELKLSLTDLLPQDHPSVLKFNKLTEIVGGVGYLSIVLQADDKKSHIELTPKLSAALEKIDGVRSVFYKRDQYFFSSRLLYYMDLPKLAELDKNIQTKIRKTRREFFDLGLWEDEDEGEPVSNPSLINDDLKSMVKKSAGVSPYLQSQDERHLLLMIKPDFDSTDMLRSKKLVDDTKSVLATMLPSNVSYDLGERYYNKIVETEMIQSDIFYLGSLALIIIAGLILFYLRSVTGMLVIFLPVLCAMGITIGITQVFIGHINIVTGFLMGILSGLGVDYGIHLLLRLYLEQREPSSQDADPVWRTLQSSGHSVFVGAVAAAFAFYLLCFSSLRVFSEFGFICGTGIITVLLCHLFCFSVLVRVFKIKSPPARAKKSWITLPSLSSRKTMIPAILATVVIVGCAYRVGFEYDFNKLMRQSVRLDEVATLIDTIYGRFAAPSAFAASTREDAIAAENYLKKNYMPDTVAEVVSGATIIPPDQTKKEEILKNIKKKLGSVKDSWIQKSLDVPGKTVREWLDAKPFAFADLPGHLQDGFRGNKQIGYLLYFYPAIPLNNAKNVKTFATMIKKTEHEIPRLLSGSDTVVFNEILELIHHDGSRILLMIFLSVGIFIWISVRKVSDTVLSYFPLIFALLVGLGLMVIFGVKFNIFNVAIIPTFVAMGIDIPIHMVHRARETGSGFKAARDLAASVHLALLTAGAGFGVLIFARAGVLKSFGWISLLATVAVWWVGLFLLPATLEWLFKPALQQTESNA